MLKYQTGGRSTSKIKARNSGEAMARVVGTSPRVTVFYGVFIRVCLIWTPIQVEHEILKCGGIVHWLTK